MRFFACLLALVLPGFAEAATQVPKRDFTLEVSVSDKDLETSSSQLVEYFTGEVIEEYDDVDATFAGFFFDSLVDFYSITGTLLEGDTRYGFFTYDFATMEGSYKVMAFSGLAEFSFKAGGGASYYHDFDDGEGYHIGSASWSKTTVTVTPSPVPLPAGFPLLAAGLGALLVIRRETANAA
ncbi:VPLPA-CTERM sorting domain-containing protein [uncultured Roseobacter sp.]|uniref:VPLPA-CTERM sorting domain-containing protein n=1 Tax=uncultured Roseobacter sp. TaxID=114847 RepID=UPI0026331B64|nr:VPLPA-CTERM sorting domain-containing protein [uncultured Roseobacter sp.]